MRTVPLAEWGKVLRAQMERLPIQTNLVLEELGVVAERKAKEMIGEYQPGWAPLAEATVEDKVQKGYAPPDNPLLREGDMRESIGHAVLFGAEFGMAMLVVGSPSPVALWQELGTSRIPPRPFLGRAIIEIEPEAKVALSEMVVKVLSTVP